MSRLAAQRLEDHHLEGTGEQITRESLIHGLDLYRPRVNKCALWIVKKNLNRDTGDLLPSLPTGNHREQNSQRLNTPLRVRRSRSRNIQSGHDKSRSKRRKHVALSPLLRVHSLLISMSKTTTMSSAPGIPAATFAE